MEYAIIGGTGVYHPDLLDNPREVQVKTPFGQVKLLAGIYNEREIAFIPRHGSDHGVAPHRINYHANIWALKKLGVKYIIATNAVGSSNRSMTVGDFVIVDQFLDFTKGRSSTYFHGEDTPVVHVDMTDPFCLTLRKQIFNFGQKQSLKIHNHGCYVCFEGPRYESAAEVRMANLLGGDVLGMTLIPEIVLAREAGICYASIAIVTNMGAGIGSTNLSHEEVSTIMAANMNNVRQLALDSLAAVPQSCTCEQQNVPLPGMDRDEEGQ